MSQYVSFYIRKDNTLLPIADYSRSTWIYREMNEAPWGKLKEFSYKELQMVESSMRDRSKEVERQIKDSEYKINRIADFNNSAEEKLEMISSYEEIINDCRESLEALERQIIELDFIAELTYMDYRIYAGYEVEDLTIDLD